MEALAGFSEPIQLWFRRSFDGPTRAQSLGWPVIRSGKSTLLLAPTGSGKTLTAFLSSLDRLMTAPTASGVRVLYVSPLKALAVDVERNLRAPIAGILTAAAELGTAMREPVIAVRSGDTSANDRARFLRHGAELLITTPESLYLLLTSQAARHLASLETVIIDEIHSLLPTKRGVHLFLSLERLEALRVGAPPLQRIGLSATQQPIEEAARLLGGGIVTTAHDVFEPRPVEIVDARMPPLLDVRVRATDTSPGSEPAADGSRAATRSSPSVWPAIHAPLLELIRQHRTTLVFANSRRLAERLAQSLNDLAGSELALAHHGSLAKERRAQIEAQLKCGQLPALVATSSLELGIDMGAIDLVVQVEAPPSIASGLQRIGRAGHAVSVRSHGVVFPKHRGDLLAAAAVTRGMRDAAVESLYYPRNALDVLAQQIVAMVVASPMLVDDLYAMCRRAAPFAELPRSAFEGVLDLLSGRYPSDQFAELRPRITWDRVRGSVSPRAGARRIAITNGGTIADRGLYGVFLSKSDKPVRIGELDEEMVFESRVGEVFLLGASSWRIDEITHDRVLVTPAPGQPGKMPFWKGDGPGRAAELGRKIGALARELSNDSVTQGHARLTEEHGFDDGAARWLLEYLAAQREASAVVPSDRVIVVERFRDDLGDYRVCLLSPFGRRVHAPWAIALAERFRQESGTEIDAVCSDDGIVLRLPETEERCSVERFLFDPDEVESWVVRGLAQSSFFAAHFRENAGRALLLPRRDVRRRQPLWAQRRRAAELLRVASQFPGFPILIETYRECLRDVFDMPALVGLLSAVRRRELEVVGVDTPRPSPFASTIMFSYVGNFLYEGDAPLAERRAQALTLDQTELRALLGEAELRGLLDPEIIALTQAELLHSQNASLRHADDVHDLLLLIGDLTARELAVRLRDASALDAILSELEAHGRILWGEIAHEQRCFAVEDSGKLRSALGVELPPGLPAAHAAPVANALEQIVARFARTHGPFVTGQLAQRFGITASAADTALHELERQGRLVRGEFLPNGNGIEWCDKGVLARLKQRSLAKLRHAIEPVAPEAFARLLAQWQGVNAPSRAPDALERAVIQLQGLPIAASVLLHQVLPDRVHGFSPSHLDELLATGQYSWIGVESLGASDGKVALYRTDELASLAPPSVPLDDPLAARLRAELEGAGARFFSELLRRIGGFAPALLSALWNMVWSGEVTNDTLLPLRVLQHQSQQGPRGRPRSSLRARPSALPGSEGRWSLVSRDRAVTETERRTARALQLLERYGVVGREVAKAESLASFAELYPVFRALEEAGKVRRGYFVAGLGGAQFAQPGADELLRRQPLPHAPCLVLAATDPANPYGAALPWPPLEPRPQRVPATVVVLREGYLLAVIAKGDSALSLAFDPDDSENADQLAAVVSAVRILLVKRKRRMSILETINGEAATQASCAASFLAAGFGQVATGLCLRRESSDCVEVADDDAGG